MCVRHIPRFTIVCAAVASLPSFGTGWRVAELNGAPRLYHDGKPVAAKHSTAVFLVEP